MLHCLFFFFYFFAFLLINASYLGARARLPLTLPVPLPIPEPRTLGILDTLLFPAELPPRGIPLPLVLNPLVPLAGTAVPACLLLSSSSARRLASSRRLCSSTTRRSAACCFCIASASTSRTSCVAPFQVGSCIRRWLCSVCESIRVQVFSRADELETVPETVCEWLAPILNTLNGS